MSFTDIGKILKDSDKEKKAEQQRTRQEFLSSQAYTLFSEGKSPVAESSSSSSSSNKPSKTTQRQKTIEGKERTILLTGLSKKLEKQSTPKSIR